MNLLPGEPGLIGSLILTFLEWWDRHFGRRMSFGEMLIHLEETARLQKLVDDIFLKEQKL